MQCLLVYCVVWICEPHRTAVEKVSCRGRTAPQSMRTAAKSFSKTVKQIRMSSTEVDFRKGPTFEPNMASDLFLPSHDKHKYETSLNWPMSDRTAPQWPLVHQKDCTLQSAKLPNLLRPYHGTVWIYGFWHLKMCWPRLLERARWNSAGSLPFSGDYSILRLPRFSACKDFLKRSLRISYFFDTREIDSLSNLTAVMKPFQLQIGQLEICEVFKVLDLVLFFSGALYRSLE